MWLRTGSASAASTSGATGVGPGIMSSGGAAIRRFMLPHRRAGGRCAGVAREPSPPACRCPGWRDTPARHSLSPARSGCPQPRSSTDRRSRSRRGRSTAHCVTCTSQNIGAEPPRGHVDVIAGRVRICRHRSAWAGDHAMPACTASLRTSRCPRSSDRWCWRSTQPSVWPDRRPPSPAPGWGSGPRTPRPTERRLQARMPTPTPRACRCRT